MADKFCGNCGAKVEWGSGQSSPLPEDSRSQSLQCSLCGNLNPPTVIYCEVCGAALTRQRSSSQSHQKNLPQSLRQKKPSASGASIKPRSFRFLQSWKLTVGLGVVFAGVLVVAALSRNPTDRLRGGLPSQAKNLSTDGGQALHEIEHLQKVVDANPGDMESTLQLANRLHDVKFFPRAVTMYQRYLKVNSANPDARVDLGICFFEMALADSSRRSTYFHAARSEMEKALTYNPKHQLAYFNLGIVSLQSGDLEEANTLFKKCVDLNPNSETGKRAQQLYNQHQLNTLTR